MTSLSEACPITDLDYQSHQEIRKTLNAWEGWIKTQQALSHNQWFAV
jgi:hypothetical protein